MTLHLDSDVGPDSYPDPGPCPFHHGHRWQLQHSLASPITPTCHLASFQAGQPRVDPGG